MSRWYTMIQEILCDSGCVCECVCVCVGSSVSVWFFGSLCVWVGVWVCVCVTVCVCVVSDFVFLCGSACVYVIFWWLFVCVYVLPLISFSALSLWLSLHFVSFGCLVSPFSLVSYFWLSGSICVALCIWVCVSVLMLVCLLLCLSVWICLCVFCLSWVFVSLSLFVWVAICDCVCVAGSPFLPSTFPMFKRVICICQDLLRLVWICEGFSPFSSQMASKETCELSCKVVDMKPYGISSLFILFVF